MLDEREREMAVNINSNCGYRDTHKSHFLGWPIAINKIGEKSYNNIAINFEMWVWTVREKIKVIWCVYILLLLHNTRKQKGKNTFGGEM